MIPREYLVNHGRASFLGRFVNCAAGKFDRGDQVVLRTARGLEVGEVLSEAAAGYSHLVGVPAGDLLRAMTADDMKQETECQFRAQELLTHAQAAAESTGLPATFLDAELFLDGERAIVQVLPFGDVDLSPLAASLSERFSVTVLLHNLRQPVEKEPEGCGKLGCGSPSGGGCTSCGTGGGCSTGSCSKGSVKNADELTDQFVRLRHQMEAHFGRVPLHG